jgi:hypothetical protein
MRSNPGSCEVGLCAGIRGIGAYAGGGGVSKSSMTMLLELGTLFSVQHAIPHDEHSCAEVEENSFIIVARNIRADHTHWSNEFALTFADLEH